MITLTATINLLSGSGAINSLSIDKSKNNISSDITNVKGTTKNSKSAFILGSSKLGFGYRYSSNIDYFISKQLCDNSGIFKSPFTIDISGINISNLTIVFDTSHKQYPKNITVDGISHSDDDPTYVITGLTGNTHTIEINNWNEPNSPLIIQGIYTNITIHLDNRYFISIFREVRNAPDADKPSYGIISNVGGIKFNDLSLEFRDYIEQQLLVDGVKVSLFINNTINSKKQLIGNYETHDWKYDNHNFVVDVSFGDNLVNMQKIYLQEFPQIAYKQGVLITLQDVFTLLNKQTKGLFNEEVTNINVDLTTSCNSYKIDKGETLWSVWNGFCQSAKCYMYKDPMTSKIIIISY